MKFKATLQFGDDSFSTLAEDEYVAGPAVTQAAVRQGVVTFDDDVMWDGTAVTHVALFGTDIGITAGDPSARDLGDLLERYMRIEAMASAE